MQKKFIIFASPRSGSTMFVEFLHKQKKITCRYEIFKKFHDNGKFPAYGPLSVSAQAKMHELLESNHNSISENRNEQLVEFHKKRTEQFEKYIQIIQNDNKDNFFGFKLFFYSNLILDQKKSKKIHKVTINNFFKYLKNENYKAIHLTRDNKLEQYISWILAKTTKVFRCSEETKQVNSVPVNVNYSEFNTYKLNHAKDELDVKNTCLEYSLPYFHVTYEQLIGQDYVSVFKKVLSFIGANPNEFIDITKDGKQRCKKQNTFNITDKIINYNELVNQTVINNDADLLRLLTNV
jgi:LPS sulfotransferase NodH